MSKIRNGFVSNSSSSSFVCEVCGTIESGMDISCRDMGFEECKRGHMFCAGHGLKVVENDEIDDDDDEECYGEDDEDDEGYVDITCCPICQLKEIRDQDMLTYLLKKSKLTRKKCQTEMVKEFKTYEGLQKGLK